MRCKLIVGFGFDFNSLESKNQPVVSAYQYLYHPTGLTRLVFLACYLIPGFKFLPISATRKMREERKILQDAAMSMIHIKQERERTGDKEGRGDGDILGVMIQKNRENREKGSSEDALSEMEMVNQIMTFLAAGFVL